MLIEIFGAILIAVVPDIAYRAVARSFFPISGGADGLVYCACAERGEPTLLCTYTTKPRFWIFQIACGILDFTRCLYLRDPEGNRVEVFIDTPWHVTQPYREPMDLSLPTKKSGSGPRRTQANSPVSSQSPIGSSNFRNVYCTGLDLPRINGEPSFFRLAEGAHAGLGGGLPEPNLNGGTLPISFASHGWRKHRRGLYQTPIRHDFWNSPPTAELR